MKELTHIYIEKASDSFMNTTRRYNKKEPLKKTNRFMPTT